MRRGAREKAVSAVDVNPESANVENYLDWIAAVASPLIAALALIVAISRGMFQWTWRSGTSLGQMQTIQEEHTKSLAALREIVDTLVDDRKGLATKDDIHQLSIQIADLNREIFDLIKSLLIGRGMTNTVD